MLVADAAEAPAVDYYAGATAFRAVTMFARYAIHKTKERPKERGHCAAFWHKACVIGSAAGIVISLAVLGFDDNNWLGGIEYIPRGIVGIAVVEAAVVLAIDISTTPSRRGTEAAASVDPDRSIHP
jgi:sugar phosphate permease